MAAYLPAESGGLMRRGFSLVELSIVLVILGLLVGGILAGQSLIRASELRAQIGQINQIQTAYMAFRDKYLARPGDMSNATSFWASSANGNGDGVLNGANGDRGTWSSENARFFEQLSLAGLIDGTYTASGALGTGFPALKYNSSAGMMANMPPVQFGAEFRPRDYDRNWKNAWYLYLYLCNLSVYPTVQVMNNCGIFTPADTWNMDTKTDDGVPYTGRFIGIGESGYACLSNTTAPGTYALSNNDNLCTAGWQLD